MSRRSALAALGTSGAIFLSLSLSLSLATLATSRALAQTAPEPRAADAPPGELRAPRPDPWVARPLGFTMAFGPRSPAGTWAGEVEWAQTRFTAIAFGVGLAPAGTQVSVMPRLYSPIGERLSIGVGLGVSEGRYLWDGGDALGRSPCTDAACANGIRQWTRAVWGNLELSIAERRAWGLTWRVYGGGGRLLNPGDGICISDVVACTRDSGVTVVFGGVGVGFAL